MTKPFCRFDANVLEPPPNTYLHHVLGGGQAIRYGIGVGRDGFTWSGVQSVTKKAEMAPFRRPFCVLPFCFRGSNKLR